MNVDTRNGISVMELINAFEKANDAKVKYAIGPRRAGDVESCWADTTKMNTTMNWKSTKTIDEAMKDSWEWQKTL